MDEGGGNISFYGLVGQKKKMAIGRVVGVGREFRWPPKENHTKGGMKKLLLCTKYGAHTVPKTKLLKNLMEKCENRPSKGLFSW